MRKPKEEKLRFKPQTAQQILDNLGITEEVREHARKIVESIRRKKRPTKSRSITK